MVIPKTLPIWGPGVVNFASKVKVMTSGKLDIKVYGAGELVPALQTFDAVKSGSVQMGHSSAYYWQGKLPASVYFTSVPFGMNSLGMKSWLLEEGQALWDELYKPHGVFSLSAGNTGIQMGGWFNKKINGPEDFKGLKMRIPGLGGKVVEKLGGSPTLVAGGEIYTNLATGVIDATEWVGPYHDYIMGFHKAAKYYYYPGWHEPGSALELMISQKAWNTLPKEYQEIIRISAKALDHDLHAQWLAKDSEYFQKIKNETKVKVLPFPESVIVKFKAFAFQLRGELGKTSPLAQRITDSFNSFQKRYEAYQDISERAYVKAQNT
jgi:TRAP-type mannitol/chloroaromatic compound transport system substrate-binding protein